MRRHTCVEPSTLIHGNLESLCELLVLALCMWQVKKIAKPQKAEDTEAARRKGACEL